MSYLHRFRSELSKALDGHRDGKALLANLEIVLHSERHDAYTLGQLDTAAPVIVPENPSTWEDLVKVLVAEGCVITLSIGSHGVGCAVIDPEIEAGFNRRGETVQEAVNKAYRHRRQIRPEVVA